MKEVSEGIKQKGSLKSFCDFRYIKGNLGKYFFSSVFSSKINARLCLLRSCISISMGSVLILLLAQVSHAQMIENVMQDQDINLVWSAKNYGQGEQVYFSSLKKNSWSTPVQLSHGAKFVFQPAVSFGTDGKVWVVWLVQDSNGSSIQFTVYSASKWMQPSQINTGMNNNKAVSIIVDRNNVPWIAWTAVNDLYPDVFWSKWNGQGWDLPLRAHGENKVPDLHPALSLDGSGNINLSWQTFADGKYVTVSQVWNGQQWQIVSNESGEIIRNKMIQRDDGMLPVPDFVEDPRKATLFIKRNDGAGSLPLSLF